MDTLMTTRAPFDVTVHPEIDFTNQETPEAVFSTPGMLSRNERQLLYGLANRNFSWKGNIIDGGSFLGASAVSMAKGLLDSGRADKQKNVIHAYELGMFPAPPNGREIWQEFGEVRFKRGESFLPILKKNIAPYNELISLHEGDLNGHKWSGEPIEICFLDVCKTAELNRHVTVDFMPHLIPSTSLLINQDFFFDRLPWIKVTMGYLHEYFEWYGQVHSSSIYKCIKQIPEDVARYDPFTLGSLEECLRYHDVQSNETLPDMYKFRMEISKAYLMAYKARKSDALDYLQSARHKYEHTFHDEGVRGETTRFRYERAVRLISKGRP